MSDRKRADRAQAYLAAIVDSADDAIIAKDLDGIIQSCNAATERIFGFAAHELVGQPVRILIPQDRQSEEDDILARLRRGERIEHFETVRRRKDGRTIDVALTVSPVRDSTGAIIGASKIARDITEQRKASTAQAFLAAIVASSDDAIIAKDLNGIIQQCNEATERIFGYSAAELVGRPVRILIPAERQGEEDDILRKIRNGERIDHFETQRVRKDGQLLDVSLTISPIKDTAGHIIGVSKIARDVTAQKRAAAALAEQQAWFRITLGSIGDAVIACDPDGAITFVNATAERLTGWKESDAVGRPLEQVFNIVNEQSRHPVENPAMLVARLGQVVGLANHTLLISREGVERPIADSAAPIRDASGRMLGVVLVFRDVTAERRAQQALAEQRERLLAAERAARTEAERASRVKDEFVAMVSHELRTPLNAILGWTQLMMREKGDPAMLDRGLEIVARNTHSQAQLISDLLDISRIVTGKLELTIQAVDVCAITADAIETIRYEAEAKGVTIEQQLDRDSGVVAGDPARLQQVVWNLLSNAVKFTPSGGRVSAVLRPRAGNAELTISDTGVGIGPEVLPHIFDRFQQADRSITRRFGGLGLGLSIVRHLTELHGGSVSAESDGPGRGSTFRIVLPTSAEARSSDTSSAHSAQEGYEWPTLECMRVLIVEDEPDSAEFLRRLLESQGATVVMTRSASEALAEFDDKPPHILVSDIGLPEVDGYKLIRQIRRRDHEQGGTVPAIALTAYARAEDRTRALRAGYQAHLAKPVDPGELLMTISSFLGLIGSGRKG